MAREVGPDDDEGAGEGECQACPEGDGGAAPESEPCDEANKDGRLIAEQRGVGGGGANDRRVVEGEIEREEEAADGDDCERARADAWRAPVVEPCRDEEQRREQHSVEGGCCAGDVSPADEDGGPRDADDAGYQSEVRQDAGMLAG